MNLARSASCCATCLDSIAWVYSRPKVNCVIETSSNTMLKWSALCVKILRMSLLTTCNCQTLKVKLSSLTWDKLRLPKADKCSRLACSDELRAVRVANPLKTRIWVQAVRNRAMVQASRNRLFLLRIAEWLYLTHCDELTSVVLGYNTLQRFLHPQKRPWRVTVRFNTVKPVST